MLRAPSLAAQCTLRAVGSASRRERSRATLPSVRALVDSATRGSSAAHVAGDMGQQRRHVTHSSRRCGWSTAVGVPGLGNDDARECNKEASPSQRERHGTPSAMLTTRLRSMFSSKGTGPWWLAVHLLEKGRQEGIKDVKAYNVVLKMIATCERMSEDKLTEMDRLFEQMTTKDGLEPEARTYSHLIYGYSQAKKEEEAVRLLEEMVARGLKPERRTLSSMIVAHSWGSVEDMRRVAAEMRAKGWQPTRRANSAMIGALRRDDDCAGILQVARSMVEEKQTMTEASLVLAIRAASNVADSLFARELLVLHSKHKYRPQEQLHVCVMLALRNESHYEECLCCWRELVLLDGLGDVTLDERTYNLALSSAVKAERWQEMEAIFDMMQAKSVEPTLSTWRSMVDVWSTEETEDVSRLDRIFGSMDRRGWEPCRAVRFHAAMAYTRSGDWHKAIAWFEPALAEDNKCGLQEMDHLLGALAGLQRYGEMKDLWRRSGGAKDKGLLRAGAVAKMAEAARELGDSDWALELYFAASRGTDVTRHMWPDVVRTLTKAGRLDEAARVLQQARPRKSAPLETPITREIIVAAFCELAHSTQAAAFVDELREEASESGAADNKRASEEVEPAFTADNIETALGEAASATSDTRNVA
eukprot:g7885.t1